MTYQTTIGWSLLTSGIVSLILWAIPGKSIWWGLLLLVAGLVILYVRRNDVQEALSSFSS